MLKVITKPHRTTLRANDSSPQKVFVMLKVIPSREVASSRPSLALALVVDTSTSMRAFVDQEAAMRAAWGAGGGQNVHLDGANYHSLDSTMPTLLDQAVEAAHTMIDDARLLPHDQITIIHFDDNAATLLPLSPLAPKANAHGAIELLKTFTGETRLGRGLKLALDQLKNVAPDFAKRVFVLTDGATRDERECLSLLPQFAAANAPIIAIGFGVEYNEKLLAQLADETSGRPYHLKNMSDLTEEVLSGEIGQSTREVVTDLQLDVALAPDVQLEKISRVHPALNEVVLKDRPFRLGNIAAGDFTVYVLELAVQGAHVAGRSRLARLQLSGSTPGANARRALPPQEISIEFASDAGAATIDAEVIGYVQQKNVGRLVEDAMRDAERDPNRARQTLGAAAGMTQKLGNAALSNMIEAAAGELETTGKISSQTAKTVALGTRTRTVKTASLDSMSTAESSGLSPEEIRRLSGT